LDSALRAWDSMGMNPSDGRNTPPTGTASRSPAEGRLIGVWLVLVLACLFASTACRGHEERSGAGGQNGDEGRRARDTWLGTGGFTSAAPRP
jgi:hypothetical protein